MRLVFAGFVAALSVLAVFPGAGARAADDVMIEDTPAAAPAPQPPVRIMPPRVRVEMRQMQVQGQDDPTLSGEVRREPYLGVVTGPVNEPLRAQLELPPGIGLVVEAVAKDGPAARGGLQRFDILRKFEDQLVCTADQLSALVTAAGKGKQVTLTVIRAGKDREVEVLIDERDVTAGGAAIGAVAPFAGVAGLPLDLEGLLGDVLPEGVPGFGDDMRSQVQRQVHEALEQALAGGFGGNAGARVLQIYPGGALQNMVVVTDARGTVEIRERDGKRTVTVKDPAGTEVHAGPLDTEADREHVPEAFRGMVEEVEKRLGERLGPAAREPADQPANADEI